MPEYWLWLAHRPGMNEHVKRMLLEYFHTPEAVYHASPAQLMQIQGLRQQAVTALSDKNLSIFQAALEYCEKENIQIVTYNDEAYPNRLKNIYDPPLVLYYKGQFPKFDDIPAISIVGTRKSTAYGCMVAGKIAAEISACGGIIVSGLAAGIDAAAMTGALHAGSTTVGVLGTGVDVVFPKENRELFRQVACNGCILSEFLPKTGGLKWNFPKRNRIISGLCVATVVVEAPERSGALTTARQALEQGRDVYAVPGNIDLPSFAGSNNLLKEGAGSVTCGWDVIGEYASIFPDKIHKIDPAAKGSRSTAGASSPPRSPRNSEKTPEKVKKAVDIPQPSPYIDIKNTLPAFSSQEEQIIDAIDIGGTCVDDIIARTGIASGVLLRSLTMLELKGAIVRLPGNRIARK